MKKMLLEKIDFICHKMPLVGRIYHELIAFLIVAVALFGFKDYITSPALQLLCFKFLLISAGVLHATITRKVLFSYIEFSTEVDNVKKWFVVALYVIIIYAYSNGG